MSAWFSQHFAAAGAAAEPISAMDQQMADMAEEEGVEAGLLRRRSTLLRARAAVAEQIAMRQVAVAAAAREWALLLSIVEGEEGAVEAMDVEGEGEGEEAEAEAEAEAKAEQDEGAEDPPDWGEPAEEAEAEAEAEAEEPAPTRKIRGAAKARAVAAGTWVGRPRNRHRGVLQSHWKRVGDWWGCGPPGGGPVSMIRPAGAAPPEEPPFTPTPGGASSSGGGPP
jgi:hypothetical protein